METRKDHTATWQFVGLGFMVAFIVMVILYYNATVTINKRDQALVVDDAIVKWTNHIADSIARRNDSLYKENDSLITLNAHLRVNDPSIIVGGDQSNVIRDNSGPVNTTIKH